MEWKKRRFPNAKDIGRRCGQVFPSVLFMSSVMNYSRAYRTEDERLLNFVGDGTIVVEFDVHLLPVLLVNVRAQLLQRRFLAAVEKLVGVRHVVDVNLHTRHDRRLLPEFVRATALLYRELLVQDHVDEIREENRQDGGQNYQQDSARNGCP